MKPPMADSFSLPSLSLSLCCRSGLREGGLLFFPPSPYRKWGLRGGGRQNKKKTKIVSRNRVEYSACFPVGRISRTMASMGEVGDYTPSLDRTVLLVVSLLLCFCFGFLRGQLASRSGTSVVSKFFSCLISGSFVVACHSPGCALSFFFLWVWGALRST